MLRVSRNDACIVVLCLALASACTRGTVTATTKVTIGGTVVDGSGAAIGGASVLLIDTANSAATATVAPASLALACFLATAARLPAQEPCASARQARTDRTGSYSFTMNGAETQDSSGAFVTFVAASMIPARSGHPAVAGTSAAFQIQRPEIKVPPLETWGASVATSSATSQWLATWPALPTADATNPDSSLAFMGVSGTTLSTVWTVASAQSGRSVDPRVLEDTHGAVEVESTTPIQRSGTTFQMTYRTGMAGFAGPGAPPSRGAPCAATSTPTGTPQPCALTTGNLASGAGLTAGPAGITVDLGTARPISFVVVRGSGANVLVESSTDGTAWSSVGGIYSLPGTLSPSIPKPARYLRVRSPSTSPPRVTQISVWS